MTLSGFFPEQFDSLTDFMADEDERVRRVLVDAEMRPVLRKALAGLEDRTDFPHILVGHDAPFADALAYFAGLLELLERELEENAEALAAAGAKVVRPPSADKEPATRRFLKLAESVASGLPESVGALVFVLEPERVDDPATFRRAVAWLAEAPKADWLKFVVIEDRVAPELDEVVAANPRRVGSQCFWLSPDEVEQRLRMDIAAAGPAASPAKRQAIGLAAGMAFAKGDHAKAEALQRAVVTEAGDSGTPAESATALYNLGNTLVAKEDLEGAVGAFGRAAELCTEHDLNALAPVVFTNLGIALYRSDRPEEGFASLKVARDYFRAMGNRPGEAHVYDCFANIHLEQGRQDEAERAWRYALRLYDEITAAEMQDVRDGGRRDILAKLERLGGRAPNGA